MNRTLQLGKAIRLLDHRRNDEAIVLLQTIIEESVTESDELHHVQAVCILGGYWFEQGDLQQAKKLLEKVSNIAIADELDDLLAYEFSRAKELLNEIYKTQGI